MAQEGSLEPPKRNPIDWENPDFYDEPKLFNEMERVFDICHGCRRCVNLCTAFPRLFDLIDEGSTGELDGVEKTKYWEVADRCYLCDMCFMSKCPYVPPHPWNVDFPNLMLRAKAVKHKKGEVRFRDKLLSSTDAVGKLASIPVVAQTVNAINKAPAARKLMDNQRGGSGKSLIGLALCRARQGQRQRQHALVAGDQQRRLGLAVEQTDRIV